MIKNGYLIFAIINLILLLLLIVGVILHVYVLVNVKESLFYKYFLTSDILSIAGGTVAIIFGIILYLILGAKNDYFKNDHLDCC